MEYYKLNCLDLLTCGQIQSHTHTHIPHMWRTKRAAVKVMLADVACWYFSSYFLSLFHICRAFFFLHKFTTSVRKFNRDLIWFHTFRRLFSRSLFYHFDYHSKSILILNSIFWQLFNFNVLLLWFWLIDQSKLYLHDDRFCICNRTEKWWIVEKKLNR